MAAKKKEIPAHVVEAFREHVKPENVERANREALARIEALLIEIRDRFPKAQAGRLVPMLTMPTKENA